MNGFFCTFVETKRLNIMKSTDLRINNLLMERNGDFVKVVSINKDDTIVIEDQQGDSQGCYSLSLFNQITLTEQWLIKFGFIKDKSEIAVYYFGDLEIQLPVYFRYKESHINKIKHVHKLQNLYFALTNEELTLKQ